MDWLRSYRPDLVPRYEELYARGAYLGKEERERIPALTHRGRRGRATPALRGRSAESDPVTMPPRRPPREPAQTKLF